MADKKLYVQTGRSCTSIKGLLSEGVEVFPGNFIGGEKSITALLKAKVIGDENPNPEPVKKTVTPPSGGAVKTLDKMTVEELKIYATEKEIEIPKDVSSKADIFEYIKLAEEENK